LPGITLSSWTYTLECLSGSGDRTILPEDMPAECASLALEGDIAGGHLDRSCAMGDAGCVCDSTFTVESAYSQSYDYATTGADLMIGTNRYQYCVEGDTLKYGFEGGGDYEVYTR
jgi:hypothetical protein